MPEPSLKIYLSPGAMSGLGNRVTTGRRGRWNQVGRKGSNMLGRVNDLESKMVASGGVRMGF